MRTRLIPAAIMLSMAACGLAQTQPTTRPLPKFTVSKETTLIEGPLNADGTVDYRQAINDLLGKGVTKDNNAGPLLLSVGPARFPDNDVVFTTLGLPIPPADALVLKNLDDYARKRLPADIMDAQWEKFYDHVEILQHYPWKPEDEKEAATWLADNEPALAIVDQALARPRCFLPLIQKKGSHLALESLPIETTAMSLAKILLPRAMMHAGQQQLPDALADIHRVRLAARLAENEHLSMGHLQALAVESLALQTSATLAASGLSRADLARLRQEVQSLPALSDNDADRSMVDEMLMLDMVMSFIRGDDQTAPRLLAMDFSLSSTIKEGDLAQADWDILLKTFVQHCDEERKSPDKPFAEELKDVDAKIAATNEKYPATIFNLVSGDIGNPQASLESFITMRPGETHEAFSRRIGLWMSAGSPGDQRSSLNLEQRPKIAYALAMVSIALAEYHLDHAQYPDSLAALSGVDTTDLFSGKPFGYRHESDSFTLWSVGLNQKGVGSASQTDLIIRSHPPQ